MITCTFAQFDAKITLDGPESLPLHRDGNSTTEWSSQIRSAAELSTRQTRSQTCNKSDAT